MRSVGVEFLGFVFIFLIVLAVVRATERGKRGAQRSNGVDDVGFERRVHDVLLLVERAAAKRHDEVGDVLVRPYLNAQREEQYLDRLKELGHRNGFHAVLGRRNGAPVVRLRYPNNT